jgi:F-type H+-transporting ATPase subunit epsilon
MTTFPASLVTPERVLREGEVQAVFLRTDDGEAAFLPGHTPLVGALVPGLVRFQHEDGTEERFAVHGGFVQVEPGHVVVLAPIAERAQDIDVERARRAAEAAGTAGAAGSGDEGAAGGGADAEALRRAQLRLEVAGT